MDQIFVHRSPVFQQDIAHCTVAVIGLGYVGLPLAIALAKHTKCIGFDISQDRIDALRQGHDATREVSQSALGTSSISLTSDLDAIRGADIYIVAVPTPVDTANNPDLRLMISASQTVGAVLEAGRNQIIVYESTVYPGVTEDVCGPVLEKTSGLVCGEDFFLGYSPERINPGDREHTVDKIVKVVAGQTPEVLDILAKLYGALTTGGVFRAASIKVAEAAKVIENAQRDINIAFMNEIAMIFQKMGISTYDVLDVAKTKWNFLPFSPGLVGGHCIGVDPYYLAHCAQMLGHQPHVILSGRHINDGMGQVIADSIHGELRKASDILVLGITFKEDVPDLRNSKVASMIQRLQWIGHTVFVADPMADAHEVADEYGITLVPDAFSRQYDAVILAVPHESYRSMDANQIEQLLRPDAIVADIKGLWRALKLPDTVHRWQL
jgi:UDP-N-acetyl-D-glucosamine/UDP-N-acetyl-D-galactosamine dehydrogenase